MSERTIQNPVINGPYEEPTLHHKFDDEGITNEIAEGRRVSSYFMPIPATRKKALQETIGDWTGDRVEENKWINRIRFQVARWRLNGRPGITQVSRQLLDYWLDESRERRIFFCQVEALETVIYLTEVAKKDGQTWIDNDLKSFSDDANPGLYRIALKMATGSGKTFVMTMMIAWQTLNKLANPQDNRFTDAFLVVTPGITIKDRLRVLLPNDPNNYYAAFDLVPPEMRNDLHRAKIVITNFHAFKLREHTSAPKLNKQILGTAQSGAFTESGPQMVNRVLGELGSKKNIIVMNDEAHHCYRRRAGEEGEKLTGDLRKEAEERNEEARVWITGLEEVQKKLGIKNVYDLSATPFFLRGSGYNEGTLFPWVVSDFSLIDAIESGIVKVPRVPTSDDSMVGAAPTYRELWPHIRDDLPKKNVKDVDLGAQPKLPKELEGALLSLYGHYEDSFERWEKAQSEGLGTGTPPVFIVVCANTAISKLVFDWIAGWEKKLDPGGTAVVPGKLDLFSNESGGGWRHRPNTILVDSSQLESGEGMSSEFKKVAATQIEEFKAEYKQRFPDRDPNELTDEDLLREVMNTVGKPEKLGEHVRCVVSVSMLTEGWDANTVTHILGVRAFSTQLLCEQVVGRGLRRMSYVPNDQGRLDPEYADVYGVPFSFIPATGQGGDPPPAKPVTRVRALEARIDKEIVFPHVVGYRYEIPTEKLVATFSEDSHLSLSTKDIATKTVVEPIVGEVATMTLDDLKEEREQSIAFELARLVLDTKFHDDQNQKPWLYPQLIEITKRWIDECLYLKDNTFPQLLLVSEFAHLAAERIYKAITAGQTGKNRLRPILRPYDPEGSSRLVDFDTSKPVMLTSADKCHISHVVADSGWEHKMAQAIEDMDEVEAYVKNQGLGFTIPYTMHGQAKQYIPDFILRVASEDDENPLNLIIEVTGEKMDDKVEKESTARELWIPAVNNHGGLGRWAFVEVTDPWDGVHVARSTIEAAQARSKEPAEVG